MKTIITVSMICPEKMGIKTSRWMYTDGHTITITDKRTMLDTFSTMGKFGTDYQAVYVNMEEGHRILQKELAC